MLRQNFFLLFLLSTYVSVEAQEIELSGYHRCWGTLIDGDNALAIMSPNQRECRDGNSILAFKKFLRREDGIAIYEFSDTLEIKVKCPENCLYLTRCYGKVPNPEFIILIEEDYSKEYFDRIKRAWTYNSEGKLIEVDSEGLRCINEDFDVD